MRGARFYTGYMAPYAPLIASAVAALFVGAATAQPASAPVGSSAARVAAAVAACEKAARETFNNTRGPATEVAFNAPPAAQPGPADATDLVLRGSGRARFQLQLQCRRPLGRSRRRGGPRLSVRRGAGSAGSAPRRTRPRQCVADGLRVLGRCRTAATLAERQPDRLQRRHAHAAARQRRQCGPARPGHGAAGAGRAVDALQLPVRDRSAQRPCALGPRPGLTAVNCRFQPE